MTRPKGPLRPARTALLHAAAITLMLLGGTANAEEFRKTVTPGGTSDIRAAELPRDPGLYLLGAAVSQRHDAFTDGGGNPLFPDTNQKVSIGNIGLMYILPQPVLGGRLAATAVLGYGRNNLTLTNLPVGPGGTPLANDNKGAFDTYLDVFWQRSFYGPPPPPEAGPPRGNPPLPVGFSYGLGLGVTLPNGSFDGTKVGNPGFNTTVISPNVAVTWRTRPLWLDGTEFSARLFYNIHGERKDTTAGFSYEDGDNLMLDFALTERAGRTQFGLAGSIIHQISDDIGNPAMPAADGQRHHSVRLGPILAIDLPEYGMTIKAKALFTTSSKNAPDGETFSLAFIKKF